MRMVLFGQGPLCEAVQAALVGHDIVAVYDSPQPTEVLKAAQAQVGLSAGYRHKLRQEEWECFPDGILNLHTGYLPWNRGAYPNAWPIIDGSPAGVTLHRVDEGWDTGPILCQTRVSVYATDTAYTLQLKLLVAASNLVFYALREWEAIGSIPHGIYQDPKAGSFHRKADWPDRWVLNDVERKVVNQLRAASFPGHGFGYIQDGKWIEATITLKEVTE